MPLCIGCIVLTLKRFDRPQVGVVDQEPVLFAGSIADNIRYGVPYASEEDVREAARQVRPPFFFFFFFLILRRMGKNKA